MLARISAAIHRLTGWLAALLPRPPRDEAAAPDADGRRPETADTTALELEMLRKDGHGGYR